MKKTLVASVLGLGWYVTAFGQGAVNFGNYSSTTYQQVRYSTDPFTVAALGSLAGQPVTDSGVELQLFWALGTFPNEAAFQAVAQAGVTTFINPGFTYLGGGYYDGPTQVLTGWAPPQVVTFEVLAWKTTGPFGGATYATSELKGASALWIETAAVDSNANGIGPAGPPAKSFNNGPPAMSIGIGSRVLTNSPSLPSGLIAYYPFNGNGSDAGGNGYDGTLNGPTFSTNRFGATDSALSFNGTNNTFVVPSLPLLNDSFSYSAWIRIAGPGDFDLQSFGACHGLNQVWNFAFSYSGDSFDLYDVQNGGLVGSSPGTNTPLNSWVQVVVTFDSQGHEQLFYNGALLSSRNVQLPIPDSGDNSLYVGTDDDIQDQAFNGLIDDIRLYNHALSSNEVAALYSFESTPTNINISQDLTNSYVVLGSNTTLSVNATSPSQLSYQWYFLPANNSGQAEAYAEIIDGFCYAAVVTNGGFGYGNAPKVSFVGGGGSGAAGYATVSNAVVTDITVTDAGDGYTNPPAVVIDAPNGFLYGQSNGSLNITNANENSAGTYFVVVSDSTYTVTSSVVILLVLYPPSIVQNPVGFTGTYQSSDALSVVASGTPPLSYQWMLNGTNITGASGTNYVITNLTLDTTGDYSVEVTNSYGAAISSSALVALFPTLISPFAGAVDVWGQDAVFNVGAIGTGSLFYQWYFNGQTIDGATNSSYELSSIQFTNAGAYSVVVSSEYGSVTNTTYQVVVNPANISIGLVAAVTIQGTVGNNYNIQSTTNLADPNSWATVTNITLTSSIQIWNDDSSDVHNPNNPQKYYRVLPGQ